MIIPHPFATKLAIFDLDGTLLNTLNDLGVSINYALLTEGLPTHNIENYRYKVGNGVRALIRRSLPEELQNEEWVERLYPHFRSHYDQNHSVLTRPYEGIPELLHELQKRNITLAVASNKYQEATRSLVARYFPHIVFAQVFGQRDGIPVKPDPTIVHDILKATRFTADETLYVGDSGVDMETADRAKVFSVGVTWGFRPQEELEEYGAKAIVHQPKDILNYI